MKVARNSARLLKVAIPLILSFECRDDDKECFTFYSDPEFFFRKWKAELLEEFKKAK